LLSFVKLRILLYSIFLSIVINTAKNIRLYWFFPAFPLHFWQNVSNTELGGPSKSLVHAFSKASYCRFIWR
ncbi:hypothetical protein CLOSTASPAR_01425, partial [[Clostridium] asparagiforme DSM 15981]